MLDKLRRALASKDLKTATSMAKVYKLETVAAKIQLTSVTCAIYKCMPL